MNRFIRKLFRQPAWPAEHFQQGVLECVNCARLIPFTDEPELMLRPCPGCGEPNFIPKCIAGYWLFAPIGGGGMGSVYKAYHQDQGPNVYAVKILPREKKHDERLRANLRHEIEVMQTVRQHPCIAGLIATGEEDDELYMVTRFVLGERLDHRINRMGRLPERQVLLLALRLLSGLTHVYCAGFLFRDTKPQNVIIGEKGACMVDFGICISLEDARRGDPDNVQGSALYYPPERLTEAGEGPHSEIYSLGMVMYHALTGSPYFTAKDIETMTSLNVRKTRLLKGDSRRSHEIRPDLSRILERMIKRDPTERYHSFIDVEHDLLQVVANRH